MKKAGLLVLACSLLVMVGCSGGEKGEKPEAAGTKEKKVVVKKEEKPSKVQPRAREVNSYSYVIEITDAKEGRSRLELKAQGRDRLNMKMFSWEGGAWKEKLFMIQDGSYVYLMNEETKTATKFPADTEMKSTVPEEMIFIPEWNKFKKEELGDNAFVKKVGTEEVNGVKTTKYEVSLSGEKNTAYIYVDEDDLMRRQEVFDPAGKLLMKIDFIKVEINPEISNKDFTPPADYKVMDMSEMMKNLPQMPKEMPSKPE